MRALLPALLLVAAPVSAEEARPTTLTIVAEGHFDRAPDVAELSGGVVTQAPTAAAALAENARRMTDVVAAVRRAGVAERDIQTSGLSLQPQYRYGDNHPPVLTGYQATNTVALKVRKLADAGAMVDALVAAGANQVNGPSFRVEDAEGTLNAARTAAVVTARARAELYAAAAGLHVARIRSIAEGTPARVDPNEIVVTAARKFAAPATPVAPGEVTLGATVTVVFDLD
ncbi:MAG: SIMPL domain-containing protein [Sphingomonadaceae bacterium]|nr:SIMPL domain-containing protein [Sphingomonadaceae bacterium]